MKESHKSSRDAETMIANISSEMGAPSVLRVFRCMHSLLI